MERGILVPEVCPPPGTLGEAIASWLETMPWDFWWTITCKRPRTDEIALIRDITERSRHLGADGSFIACEPHRFNHNLHAHGLFRVGRLGQYPLGLPVTASDAWESFFCRFGRSRVEPIRSKSCVTAYCSKYVTKISDGDNWALWSMAGSGGQVGGNGSGVAYPERSAAPLPWNPVTQNDYNELDRLLREHYTHPLF